jgi:GNAT superfamily N-acetyltransferase
VRIHRLHPLGEREIQGLSEVLMDCVEGGASVSFMLPFPREKAASYWRGLSGDVLAGKRIVLAAEDSDGRFLGTVSVVLDLPENQPHRGDVSKMLVHRRARRTGVGAKLLEAAEACAAQAGRSLLVLDTASDDAERLYERAGWQRCGRIPYYALMPDGAPCATTVYFKLLFEFRPYAAADLAQCLALFDANCPAFFAPNERADYETFLRKAPAQYTVCVVAGRVAGAFGLFARERGGASLNWILISLHVQGTGVGSQMMQRAIEEARRLDCRAIDIAASHKSAPFFARFGALKISETADGWGPGMHRIDLQLTIGAST